MADMEQYNQVIAIGVDMQNDFCPSGTLAVPEGDKVIPVFNRVAEWVRNRDGIVALTADWHPEQTSHFDKWPRHCVAGTPGADFHPDLVIAEGDRIYRKGTEPDEDGYSGFDGENYKYVGLEERIEMSKSPVAVLIGGLATDYCVKATAIDAAEKTKNMRYVQDVYVVEDAVAAVNLKPNDGTKALRDMELAGVKRITSEEILHGSRS